MKPVRSSISCLLLAALTPLEADDLPPKVATESRIDRHALVTRHNISSLDMVAVRIESPLVESGELEAILDFGYPAFQNKGWVGDFNTDTNHETRVLRQSGQRVDLLRKVDAGTYHA
jgi:hypothetical protein